MSEKAKEDNAKQPLHHDLDSISRHLCTQRRDEAPKGMIVQGVVQQSMLWAKTGRSPNRNTAQGNTLGNSEPSNLRSERAIGMILRCVLATSFCSFRAQNSSTNPTQGDTLGYNPIGASPRSCSWSFPLYAFLSPITSNQWLVNTCPFPSPLLSLAPHYCIIPPYHHWYAPPSIITTIPFMYHTSMTRMWDKWKKRTKKEDKYVTESI